jgi:hypothetical protein
VIFFIKRTSTVLPIGALKALIQYDKRQESIESAVSATANAVEIEHLMPR